MSDFEIMSAEARDLMASYRATIDKLTDLLRETRPHCIGQGLECCGCGSSSCLGPPECCGEPIDLADRIGFALTMLEPHEVSQS